MTLDAGAPGGAQRNDNVPSSPPDVARVIATFAAKACMVPCFRGWNVYDPATAVVNAMAGSVPGHFESKSGATN